MVSETVKEFLTSCIKKLIVLHDPSETHHEAFSDDVHITQADHRTILGRSHYGFVTVTLMFPVFRTIADPPESVDNWKLTTALIVPEVDFSHIHDEGEPDA
jgi:hypothetical protein